MLKVSKAVSAARARFKHSPWSTEGPLLDPEQLREDVVERVQPGDPELICDAASDPQEPEHEGQGIELYRLNWMEASVSCNAAIIKAPDNGRYHYNLGRAMAAQRDFFSAEKQYRDAIDRRVWIGAAALADMILANYISGKAEEGVRLLETASEHRVGISSWRLAGMLWRGELVNQNRVRSIEEALKAAINGVPAAHMWIAQNIEEAHQDSLLPQALFHYAVAAKLYKDRKDYVHSELQNENRARIARLLSNEVAANWFERAILWRIGEDLPQELLQFAKRSELVTREPDELRRLVVYTQPRIADRTVDGCLKTSLSKKMFGGGLSSECSNEAQHQIASHFCRTQGYAEGHGETKDTQVFQHSVKLVIEPGQKADLNFARAPDNRGGFIFTEIRCQ